MIMSKLRTAAHGTTRDRYGRDPYQVTTPGGRRVCGLHDFEPDGTHERCRACGFTRPREESPA